ncbi:hypothetical protein ACN20G_35895 (plasmid) [Streptomyces sp. BI20]|uniref:hypothetical protein n=1 Tax=Streptomyces sp. BI20 TaxID=3403460 RepID=UPI003C70E9B4
MTRFAHAALGVLAAVVLAGTLAGCGGEAGDADRPGDPCPSSSPHPSPDPPATPEPSGTTGAPGDSQEHSVTPHPSCPIESGVPDMPVDP